MCSFQSRTCSYLFDQCARSSTLGEGGTTGTVISIGNMPSSVRFLWPVVQQPANLSPLLTDEAGGILLVDYFHLGQGCYFDADPSGTLSFRGANQVVGGDVSPLDV